MVVSFVSLHMGYQSTLVKQTAIFLPCSYFYSASAVVFWHYTTLS